MDVTRPRLAAPVVSAPAGGAILRGMRFFNTSGPVVPARHYALPPLARLDLDEVRQLIWQDRYFVLHAPRQTGKTSALLALRNLLNREGDVRCVYANVEGAQTARENVGETMRTLLSVLAEEAEATLGDSSLPDRWSGVLDSSGPHDALRTALVRWTAAAAKPLVLLLDEVDALVGDSLISVLRQLRSGYPKRPERFPSSVVLCGVRDVRDYRIHASSEKEVITGGSAFNIKAESLRLGDFGEEEVRTLLTQHTEETGQAFTEGALAAVWEETRGQPWLVNALAYQVCFRNRDARNRSRTVTKEMVLTAREALILRRDTHLDQLADKLGEPRVQRVIEPILTGSSPGGIPPADLEYVRDLGLVTTAGGQIAVANPIYAEVIPRELTWAKQVSIALKPAWYIREDGSLDVAALLRGFQQFFRENAEHWVDRFDYREAGPQAAGVFAAGVEQRGEDRAGVWVGAGPGGPGGGLAVERDGGEDGGGVQGRENPPRPDDPGGGAADPGVHGPGRDRGGTPGGVRPPGGPEPGGADLPARGGVRGRSRHRLGHVALDSHAPE